MPGNLVVGPLQSQAINGTMTRLRDIMTGTNTLKGAADLAIVHVEDVVTAHEKAMTNDSASGRSCHYYEEVLGGTTTTTTGSGGFVELREVPWPDSLNVVNRPYAGEPVARR